MGLEIPASQAAHQIESGGAAILKTTCCQRNRPRIQACFAHKASASRTTRRTPTDGPQRSVPAKTKVSEIEMLALTDGSLTDSQPAMNVNAASGSHLWYDSGGWPRTSIALTRTVRSPRPTTEKT